MTESNTPAPTLTPATDDHLETLADIFLTPRPSEPTARDLELASNGQRLTLKAGLAAWSWGPTEGAPTILLVHGWESRATHWGAFIAALIEAGFRAIAIDAPAHGESPGVQTHGPEYAAKLVAIGDELGELAGVVAHSFGVAATVIALCRGFTADRVALISGPSSLWAFVEDWGTRKGVSWADLPRLAARISRKVGEPIENFDVPNLVKGLTTPALIVHDRDDAEIPVDQAEAVAAAWPGSTLLLTEKLGHRRILISRKVVQAVVEFFKSGEDRPSA